MDQPFLPIDVGPFEVPHLVLPQPGADEEEDYVTEPGVPLVRLRMVQFSRRGVVTLLDECWGLGPDRATFEVMAPHSDYVLPSLDDMHAIYPGLSREAIAGCAGVPAYNKVQSLAMK